MKRVIRFLLCATGILVITGCSTTKRIPEGEMLYTGIKKVKIIPPEGEKTPSGIASEINEAVAYPPNYAILGSSSLKFPLPYGLWVWNNWPNPEKGFKHWLFKKLATEPVLVSDVRPQLRVKSVDDLLDDNGYFRGKASYELVQGKNPKKAAILYKIETGPAYRLDSIELLPDTCHLYHSIDSLARLDPYLRRGERYSVDSLSAARTRITNALRNQGYYFFRPDYIEYLADSVQSPLNISLRMMLASNIPPQMLWRYKTGDVTVYAFRNRGGGTPDPRSHRRADAECE